jgi:acetyltransferase-like isoleucine patch superfamily enzyme
MNISRLIKKTLFHVQKAAIGTVAYFDARMYMDLYNGLLKRSGFKINGTARFIARSVQFDDFSRITLGDRLVASMNVHFLTHDYSFTTALIAIGEKPDTDVGILRDIVVGDNVFIGMNSILLPGTIIGNNVIVGAGSVVRGTIPDYSLVAGNPAVVIGDIREYAAKIKNREAQSVHVDKR